MKKNNHQLPIYLQKWSRKKFQPPLLFQTAQLSVLLAPADAIFAHTYGLLQVAAAQVNLEAVEEPSVVGLFLEPSVGWII